MSVLQIEGLTKVYRGGVRANDDISLVLQAGEVFGLLGPNGAGKTTLVGQVLGLVRPTSGEIRLDGIDVVRNPARARELCSYQPQTAVPVEGLTPLQAIALTGRIRRLGKDEARRRAEALVERLELGEWRDKRTALSGGVRRLVAFCMAAVAPGRVVVLDEPTNDVDPLRRKRLWDEVRALADAGSAVLLVTHNVLEAERCVDRLAIVDRGRVEARGTPAFLKAETGSTLRLEVVLEPGAEAPDRPGFAENPLMQGRRVLMGVPPSRVGDAVAWARALQEGGRAEEFSVGPSTLEDVYVRCVERAVVAEGGAAAVRDGVRAP